MIYSPRLNMLYHHDDAYASRFSVGQGFRAPTSFFEQNHGVIADSRITRQIDKAETSDNASYALSYAADRLNWTASANFNRINNMATLQTGQAIPGSTLTETIFTSLPDPVIFRTFDWVGNYQLTPSTLTTLGLEKSTYTFSPGALNFSRPEERAYLTLDSTQGAWDWLVRWTWTGKQNLAAFYNYAADQQYNLDGTPKPDWSPSFSEVDVSGQYKMAKEYSLFFGANNLLDFRQSAVDSFLTVHGSTGNIDTIHIWGPQIGRTIFVGLKAEL
jgi:outer membrane receptor for ferrienterochelin and colicins